MLERGSKGGLNDLDPSSEAIHRVHQWLNLHIDQLLTDFDTYRTRYITEELPDIVQLYYPDIALLDPQFRGREEMNLCRFWKYFAEKNSLPPSFRYVDGSVKVVAFEDLWREPEKRKDHLFLVGEAGVIVDHSVAQFVRNGRLRGERLEQLQKMAPHLFHTFTSAKGDTFTVLAGGREEIKEQIGIAYIDASCRAE